MRQISAPRILMLALATFVTCAQIPTAARECNIDAVPAATLLLPYFEVDVHDVTPPFPDITVQTVFVVVNTSASTRIAHVTLWTEWAIPTASFDIVLSPYDAQSVNLIDVFTGSLPPSPTIAACAAKPPGILRYNPDLPVTGNPVVNLNILRQAHTGAEMSSAGGNLLASSSHPGIAKGYVTIDVVRQCTDQFPSSKDYFKDGGTGIATDDNFLVGDFDIVDEVRGVAIGDPLVHIRADAGFTDGKHTFYAAYVGGHATDDRQPLGNLFATRQFTSFAGDPTLNPLTDLLVWRDCKNAAPAPVRVGQPAPCNLTLPRIFSCDEAEDCGLVLASLPLATQRVGVNVPGGIPAGPNAGWMRINLNELKIRQPFGRQSQGWVVMGQSVTTRGLNVATGLRAFRLQSPCIP